MSHSEVYAPHFEQTVDQSLLNTIRGVGKAAYTLFNVPDHDSSLYEDLAKVLIHEPQPIHPPIEQELAALESGPALSVDTTLRPTLHGKDLLGHMGVFMQFTSYLPQLRPYGQTPFGCIDNLYAEIVEKGSNKPLDYAEQLTIALRQTSGDLPEALWRLFMTSRQHGRWFDSSIITSMPDFTRDQKMERMYTFAHSVAACKPHEVSPVQDAAGDTYYTWTHALGAVAFGALAERQTVLTRIGTEIMHNGTTLMHNLAHRFKPQRLPSDHTIAAAYGNAIGETLVQVLQPERVSGLLSHAPQFG